MTEMEQFLKEFGKTLKTTRKQMGLSQVNAAQSMHIDYRHYQNIEGGKINLRLDTLMKLVKFYNLDKMTRPFNLDACMDLLSGYRHSRPEDSWSALYQHFVDGGHAGFVVVNAQTNLIEAINERLFKTLGYREAKDLLGKPMQSLLMSDSQLRSDSLQGEPSKPFIVTFRTQPPAFPIPMMAVVKFEKSQADGQDRWHAIFFDRKTLDEEGHRLKDILNGYQQFMELYPQLKAV